MCLLKSELIYEHFLQHLQPDRISFLAFTKNPWKRASRNSLSAELILISTSSHVYANLKGMSLLTGPCKSSIDPHIMEANGHERDSVASSIERENSQACANPHEAKQRHKAMGTATERILQHQPDSKPCLLVLWDISVTWSGWEPLLIALFIVCEIRQFMVWSYQSFFEFMLYSLMYRLSWDIRSCLLLPFAVQPWGWVYEMLWKPDHYQSALALGRSITCTSW